MSLCHCFSFSKLCGWARGSSLWFSQSHLDPGSVEEALVNFYYVDWFLPGCLPPLSTLVNHTSPPTPCLDKRTRSWEIIQPVLLWSKARSGMLQGPRMFFSYKWYKYYILLKNDMCALDPLRTLRRAGKQRGHGCPLERAQFPPTGPGINAVSSYALQAWRSSGPCAKEMGRPLLLWGRELHWWSAGWKAEPRPCLLWA